MRLRGQRLPPAVPETGDQAMLQPPMTVRTVWAAARAGRRARKIARKAGETAGEAVIEVAADIISNL